MHSEIIFMILNMKFKFYVPIWFYEDFVFKQI